MPQSTGANLLPLMSNSFFSDDDDDDDDDDESVPLVAFLKFEPPAIRVRFQLGKDFFFFSAD